MVINHLLFVARQNKLASISFVHYPKEREYGYGGFIKGNP